MTSSALPFAAALDGVPAADMRTPQHRARVFARDCYRSELIAADIRDCLEHGGAAMAIATADHHLAIRLALESMFVDVEALISSGRYVLADADALLESLTAGGEFSAAASDELITPCLLKLVERHRPVLVLGEIVDLLCRTGNASAALELESYWNHLHTRYAFDLSCAYEIESLRAGTLEDAVRCVVHQHDGVEVEHDPEKLDRSGGGLHTISELDREMLRTELQRRKDLERERIHIKGAEGFLAQAARMFSSALDYEATLERVANLTIPAFADWCMVDLLTDAGDAFDRVAVGTHDPSRRETARAMKRRFPLRPDIQQGVSRAIVDRRPQLLRDADDQLCRTLARDEEHLASLRALSMKSCVVAPMIARDRVIGALSIVSSTRNFDEHDVWLVEQLALNAAAAIENARMFQREQLARLRVTKMQEVTAALSRVSSAQEVAEAACRIGTEAMAAHSGALWLTRPDGSLELAGSWGTPKEFIDQFRLIPAGAEETPAIRVITTGEAVWVETAEDYRRVAPGIFEKASAAGRVSAYGSVPLWFDDRTGGVICFAHPIGHRYDLEERELYFALARQCAQALDRARLYDATRSRSEETNILFQLAEAANRASDPAQIFEPALDAVTKALGIARAAILLVDPDGVMCFKAWRGLSGEYRAAVEGHSPWTRETKDPAPIFIDDVQTDVSVAASPVVHARSLAQSGGFRTPDALGRTPHSGARVMRCTAWHGS